MSPVRPHQYYTEISMGSSMIKFFNGAITGLKKEV